MNTKESDNSRSPLRDHFSREFLYATALAFLAIVVGLVPAVVAITPPIVMLLRGLCGLLIFLAIVIFAFVTRGRIRVTLGVLAAVFVIAIVAVTSYSIGRSDRPNTTTKNRDPRDLNGNDTEEFMNVLAQSKAPKGQHFFIFCVSGDSCAIADKYRDRLARAGWTNLPPVDQVARDGVSVLTYTEGGGQPPQVSDLTRAFAATSVTLNWENGSGVKGATIGSTGPGENEQARTTLKHNIPLLLKGPKDFALMIGSLK